MDNNKTLLSKNLGDRILLGLLCLTICLTFGSLVYYFIFTGKKDIYYLVLFDLSFSLSVLSFLGILWAIATPKYLERIIEGTAKKILILGAIILVGIVIYSIAAVVTKDIGGGRIKMKNKDNVSKKMMKKYKVMINGQNFHIEVDGKIQKLGFYTTKWVEAQNPKDAELKAVDLVRQDDFFKVSVRNPHDNTPMIYLKELSEVENFDGVNLPGAGYAFYPDDKGK